MTKEIKYYLRELGFSDNEIKIYTALTRLGEATAREAAKKADMPRTTAISILEKLKNDHYITTHIYRGTTYYWIESPKTIANVLDHRKEIAGSLAELLSGLYRSDAHFPEAQIYDTKSGIKQFMEKTISNLEKKSIIYTIDAPGGGNYSKIYSDKIGNSILKYKEKRDAVTRTLVPYGTFKSIDEEKLRLQKITIREMPAEINFTASLWIIKDLLVHFSGNPPFLTVIKHEAIVTSIKSIYDFLWKISEEKNK